MERGESFDFWRVMIWSVNGYWSHVILMWGVNDASFNFKFLLCFFAGTNGDVAAAKNAAAFAASGFSNGNLEHAEPVPCHHN